MNFVEPIRDRKRIAHIKNLLRGQGRYRDLLLFVVGINTALRISDLLQLKVGNFLDENGNRRRRFWVRERKRGKRQEVVINNSIREAFGEYLQAYPDVAEDPEHFVFFNTTINNYTQPIKRGQAWKFISTICREIGLQGNFGTHTLRKTWGYHARMQGVDLALIMHKLNHSSLAYIGEHATQQDFRTSLPAIICQRRLQAKWAIFGMSGDHGSKYRV
jgi:integrase